MGRCGPGDWGQARLWTSPLEWWSVLQWDTQEDGMTLALAVLLQGVTGERQKRGPCHRDSPSQGRIQSEKSSVLWERELEKARVVVRHWPNGCGLFQNETET